MPFEKLLALHSLCTKLGRKYVGGRGDPKASIWLIGEAPGADEDQQGVSFVGASGKELDRMLAEAGLSLQDCYFTNPYKVRPPNNDISRIEETGVPSELQREAFFEELHEHRPIFLVALGGASLGLLCRDTIDKRDQEAKISRWRGSLLESSELDWKHYVLPNFHPAYILREWSDRSVAVFIFQKLKEEFEYWRIHQKLQPLPERQLIHSPSFAEAREYLMECIEYDGPVSCDIELLARRVPTCCGFSYTTQSACCVELFGFPSKDQAVLHRLIDKILLSKRIVGQNWSTFDSNWMEACGFSSGVDKLDDTLVRHHVLHPEMSHKLDFQVLQYTREPYFKDEGRGWHFREGLAKLKLYNCKDVTTTLEIYYEQEKEFDDNPSLRRFYRDYEMPLARAFFHIGKRGTLTNRELVQQLREEVTKELDQRCVDISQNLDGRPVVFSQTSANALAKLKGIDAKSVLNISSVPQLKELLQNELKIKLKTNRQTGKESTGEESLNEAFAATGHPVLKDTLRVRELNKFLGTYISARTNAGVFYSCESVTGTVTGRRASRKAWNGLGSNGQNQPKHSDLGERFQEVFIARPGFILAYCDQASAEEWIVQGIIADVSGDLRGIQELKDSISSGISRHARLASQIFNLPLEKTNNKECLEYYVGKKVRHAGNYDMHADKMAAVMASEGFPTNKAFCEDILFKFHKAEPGVKQVFHKYVEHELKTKRMLRTPLGRERVFHSLRSYGDNSKIFREGYAYIPQSTVGDNNGMAILYCEQTQPGLVLQDNHDAMILEVPDSFESALNAIKLMEAAYDRVLKFPNGFEVKIPIDMKIGYSIRGLKKCPGSLNEAGLNLIWKTLHQQQNLLRNSISGQQLQPSPQA